MIIIFCFIDSIKNFFTKDEKIMKVNRTYRDCMRVLKISTREEKTVHAQNSYEHEKLKFDIIYFLKRAGHHVVAEAEFKDGSGRADIIDLTEGVVLEVLKTETLEEFQVKKSKYPSFLTVIPIRVGEIPFKKLVKFLGVD